MNNPFGTRSFIKLLASFLFLFSFTSVTSCHKPIQRNQKIRIIAVSCSNISRVPNQVIWEEIYNKAPDFLLFLGDIVYLDRKFHPEGISSEEIFAKQWEEPHFKKLINGVPYFAIWDDHDAGINNIKPKTQKNKGQNYLKAFSEARPSFISRLFNRNQLDLYKNIGVSHISTSSQDVVKLTTPNTFEKEETIDYSFIKDNIQFIMLDGISSRTSSKEKRINSEIITDEQFNWLEKKLNTHKGINILSTGSSLQLGASFSWRNYSENYERLRNMINKNDRTIVLTGDIHQNATIVPDYESVNYYELVSSGVAINMNRKGNFLVLDIERKADKSWEVFFKHHGKMHKDYSTRDGSFNLTEKE